MAKRRSIFWAVVSATAIILVASLLWWKLRATPSPIPQNISRKVDFTLFYPTKLPKSYNIDSSSFQATSGPVVTYNAEGSQGHHIIFSIQPRPETFNFEAFYAQGIVGTSKFTTDYGDAAIGAANNKLMGSLTSDESWVIVTADNPSVTRADLRTILKNLRSKQ